MAVLDAPARAVGYLFNPSILFSIRSWLARSPQARRALGDRDPVVYYLALPFTDIEGGLAPGQAAERCSSTAVIRRLMTRIFGPAQAG
jgi:hypothetical protein